MVLLQRAQDSNTKATRTWLLPLLLKPELRRLQQAKRELTRTEASRSSFLFPKHELRRHGGAPGRPRQPRRSRQLSRATEQQRAAWPRNRAPAGRPNQPAPPPRNSPQGMREKPPLAAAAAVATAVKAAAAAAARRSRCGRPAATPRPFLLCPKPLPPHTTVAA